MAFSENQIAFMKKSGITVEFSNPLSDADYEMIEDMVATYLQKHGFDKDYLPTEEGELCESILDGVK